MAVVFAKLNVFAYLDCTGGRVFSNCGTPCPLTCENHNDPPICLTACSTGCFCPSGTVLHNDMCIDPAQCPGICHNFVLYTIQHIDLIGIHSWQSFIMTLYNFSPRESYFFFLSGWSSRKFYDIHCYKHS